MKFYARVAVLFITAVLTTVVNVRGQEQQTMRRLGGDTLRMIILGDFGGIPVPPWFTYGQSKVAKQVGRMAESREINAFIELGDNFYYTGVSNSDDSRFKHTYEDMYNQNAWEHRPWYIIAGNHDHFGNVTAQIAYTKKSRRWTFPSLYYTVNYELADGQKVDFVFIDTVTLCGNTRDLKIPDANFLQMLMAPKNDELPGPANAATAETQWQWIEDQLKNSSADYLFVAGHYPVYSVGSHGPTKCLVSRLRPLLHKYNVSAYLSGHDHNLQHLSEPLEGNSGKKIHYVLSGAASRSDADTTHKNDVPRGSFRFIYPKNSWWNWNSIRQLGITNGGFAYMQVSKSNADFEFFAGDGDLVYRFAVQRRN